MIEIFEKIVAGSLCLEEPWFVEGAEFNEDEGQIHIFVGIRDGAPLPCPKCGGATVRCGYEPERQWRHSDCMFFPTYVHCRPPRVKCPKCGVQTITPPFARPNGRHTLSFEAYGMLLMADMPISKAADLMRCDPKALTSILRYWVGDAVSRMDLSDVTSIAIDETSFKRGHDYVTLVIDAVRRAVIDVEDGRGKSTVTEFAAKLLSKGGSPEKVRAVTSDMSSSFVPAIKETFKNAALVIDKFHVKKVLIEALEAVRKAEQKESADKSLLFRGRRLFMIPGTRMTEDQRTSLASLSKMYPKTGRAYRIVAALDDIYGCRSEDAHASRGEHPDIFQG